MGNADGRKLQACQLAFNWIYDYLLFMMKVKLKRFFHRGFLVLIIFIFATNMFIWVQAKPYIYKSVENVKEAQTGLILGAAVGADGTLSPIFKHRVDKALELYKQKKVSKILASGDNSTVYHNEVNPVRNYLLSKGVPAGDIFLDHAGFDTYSTMYRARDIFKVSSIVIVTQAFHLPRAVFIARSLGIDAYGISALNGKKVVKNYIREIFANEKAIFNVMFDRKPKFLGKEIPI